MKFTQFFLNIFKSNNEQIIMTQPQVKPETIQKTRATRVNTKHQQVKLHLIQNGAIDSWTAIQLYGATRLSAIIFNLKKEGYNIQSISNTAFDRNNQSCNFTTYKYIQQ